MQNIIIFSYLLGVLLVGLWAGRNIKDMKECAVAGRSFGTLIIFATLSASFIGGGFSMGNAEKVFLVGIANIVALWGFSLKEILVAKFIATRIHHYGEAISVGDIMKPAYGREALPPLLQGFVVGILANLIVFFATDRQGLSGNLHRSWTETL